MYEIVGLDVVVPAAIISEVTVMSGKNLDYSNIIITKGQVVRYSKDLKYTDIGRITPDFEEKDIDGYFKQNKKIFEKLYEDLDLYRVLLPDNYLQEKSKRELFFDVIIDLISKINYSPSLLRAVGICE